MYCVKILTFFFISLSTPSHTSNSIIVILSLFPQTTDDGFQQQTAKCIYVIEFLLSLSFFFFPVWISTIFSPVSFRSKRIVACMCTLPSHHTTTTYPIFGERYSTTGTVYIIYTAEQIVTVVRTYYYVCLIIEYTHKTRLEKEEFVLLSLLLFQRKLTLDTYQGFTYRVDDGNTRHVLSKTEYYYNI